MIVNCTRSVKGIVTQKQASIAGDVPTFFDVAVKLDYNGRANLDKGPSKMANGMPCS